MQGLFLIRHCVEPRPASGVARVDLERRVVAVNLEAQIRIYTNVIQGTRVKLPGGQSEVGRRPMSASTLGSIYGEILHSREGWMDENGGVGRGQTSNLLLVPFRSALVFVNNLWCGAAETKPTPFMRPFDYDRDVQV